MRASSGNAKYSEGQRHDPTLRVHALELRLYQHFFTPHAARVATFVGWHILTFIGILLFLPGLGDLFLTAAVYAVGMFGVTAGYHRYFSHRAFRTSRGGQLLLALLAQSTLQKGVLWWASHHRLHHRYADKPGDPHSPITGGRLRAHVGWVFADEGQGRDDSRIPDLVRFPELRFLDRAYLLPPLALALVMGLVGGWKGVVWGFAVPMLAVQHVTFMINSAAHLWGSRPFDTADRSRNNPLLALLTFGEGWHNNHHHFQAAARQGFLWWELDLTWAMLRALSLTGLIWDLRQPPASVRAARRSRSLQAAERAQGVALGVHLAAVQAASIAAEKLRLADATLARAMQDEALRGKTRGARERPTVGGADGRAIEQG